MVSVLPIHTTVDQYCANSTIKQQMSVMLSVVQCASLFDGKFDGGHILHLQTGHVTACWWQPIIHLLNWCIN